MNLFQDGGIIVHVTISREVLEMSVDKEDFSLKLDDEDRNIHLKDRFDIENCVECIKTNNYSKVF